MRATALAVRRSRAQLGLLATIVLLAALVVATVGATVGYVQSAATSGARGALDGAAPTARGVQVQTRLADDATAQDARVREVVEADLAGVPLAVDRTVRTEPLPLAAPARPPDGADAGAADDEPADDGLAADRAVLEVDPALPGVAEVAGGWPSAPGEAALHAAAAETLGLARGDVVVVGRSDTDPQAEPGTELTLVGTWRPLDEEDPRWFDDPLAVSGVDGSVVGPFVVTPETLAGLGTTPFVRWTVVPDATRVVPADLGAAEGASSLRDHLREDDAVAVRGLTVTGELAATAAEARAALAAAGAVTLVPVALLVVVSVVALVQVARLLAQTRASDVGLLVARGASTRQLVGVSAAEAGGVVGAGALLGAGGALVALRAGPDAGGVLAAPWLVAALGTAVGTALVTGVAWLQARAVARRHETDRSGRVRAAAAAGTLVLALVVAGLCLWQLLRYGSPVVTTGGAAEIDPLAVLAPAAVLVALAVVATAVLGPLTALVDRVAARGRHLTVPLAARQVARRLVVVAVPVVLVVLAAGAGTSRALRRDHDDAAELGRGAAHRGRRAGGHRRGTDRRGGGAAAPAGGASRPPRGGRRVERARAAGRHGGGPPDAARPRRGRGRRRAERPAGHGGRRGPRGRAARRGGRPRHPAARRRDGDRRRPHRRGGPRGRRHGRHPLVLGGCPRVALRARRGLGGGRRGGAQPGPPRGGRGVLRAGR
ncbi:hypothetical protein [Cellulosimicrobium sp. CUA-896]|uniref:hypothetical protein n=1 Tax=Cellulosimicrobium sp. CUA-896 TaxID=1517881 RepID=UPI0009662250|nr:hypothetical protein [Cellulosimicrobium sp. CUA-896]OLT53355.1 hypothetical protein BJF88_11885 [Cellulosimicrobium sp. CUA-896]